MTPARANRPIAANSAWSGRRALGDAGLHPALRGMRRGSSGGRGGSPPSPPRMPYRRRLTSGVGACAVHQAAKCAGSSSPAPNEASVSAAAVARGERGPPVLAGSRRSRRTRLSASATARSPSAIASNGGSAQSGGSAGPAKVCGRARVTGADRGERGGGGEAERAQREIERMDPGMGVGEPAGGLGDGHAGEQPVAHGVGCGGGAGVEPGERVGGSRRAGRAGARRSASGSQASGLLRWAADGRRPRALSRRSASVSSAVSSQDGRSRSSSSSGVGETGCPRAWRRFPKPLICLGQYG